MVKAVKELKKSSTKYVKLSEWSTENGLLYYRGKIYVPGSKLCCWILTLCHNSKLAGSPRKMENPGIGFKELLVATVKLWEYLILSGQKRHRVEIQIGKYEVHILYLCR